MNCTIQDIAHELNISRNTVSKALNGKGGVSEETKRLIFEKAREMNYRNILNETSVPASSSSQGTILFLTKASADYSEFWVNVMKGIESVLTPCGTRLPLASSRMMSWRRDSSLPLFMIPPSRASSWLRYAAGKPVRH